MLPGAPCVCSHTQPKTQDGEMQDFSSIARTLRLCKQVLHQACLLQHVSLSGRLKRAIMTGKLVCWLISCLLTSLACLQQASTGKLLMGKVCKAALTPAKAHLPFVPCELSCFFITGNGRVKVPTRHELLDKVRA